MAEEHQIEEKVTLDKLDVSVLNILMSGNKVVIPDFGYLELKAIENRRTVLFKSTTGQDGIQTLEGVNEKENRESVTAFDKISDPLKEGKVVLLPLVGTFRPIKKADGSFKVSFILSPSFRKKLAGEEENESEAIPKPIEKVVVPVPVPAPIVLQNEDPPNVGVSLSGTTGVVGGDYVAPKGTVKTPKQVQNVKTSVVGDVLVPQKSRSARRKKSDNTITIMLSIIIFIAVVLVVVGVIAKNRGNRGREDNISQSPNAGSVNIAKLAEERYGNAVFWVYIFEANRDKLTSPINIPPNTYLVIPDLLEDYSVNVNDSTEIQLAQKKGEAILKFNRR
jgi:nucleoid DNA-binding protein